MTSPDTSGLQIQSGRIFSKTEIIDVPAIDAASTVNAHPNEYSFSPWPGGVQTFVLTPDGKKIYSY